MFPSLVVSIALTTTFGKRGEVRVRDNRIRPRELYAPLPPSYSTFNSMIRCENKAVRVKTSQTHARWMCGKWNSEEWIRWMEHCERNTPPNAHVGLVQYNYFLETLRLIHPWVHRVFTTPHCCSYLIPILLLLTLVVLGIFVHVVFTSFSFSFLIFGTWTAWAKRIKI